MTRPKTRKMMQATVPVAGATAQYQTAAPSFLTSVLALLCYSAAGLLGLLGMIGWLFNLPALRVIFDGLASMKMNTAVGLLLVAVAGAARFRADHMLWNRVARSCAIAAFVIAAATLLQYLLNTNFGIDQLLVSDSRTPESAFPGRMSGATTISLLALAIAEWSRADGHHRIGQSFAGLAFTLGFLGLISYSMDVNALYSFPFFASLALHTSLAITLLAAGCLLMHTNHGFMSVLFNLSQSGTTARELVPAVVLVPFIVSALVLGGEFLLGYHSRFGIFLAATLSATLLMFVVYAVALRLQKLEQENLRLKVEHELHQEYLDRVHQAQTMGLVAGGLAHDFNNLLLPIRWAAELGQSGLDHEDPRQKHFKTIIDAADRAHGLAERMMKLGKEQPARREVLNLDQVITEFMDMLRGIAKGRAQLEMDLQAEGQTVVAVRQQLEQVFLNLVSNSCLALDARPEPQSHEPAIITLSTRTIHLPADRIEGNGVVCRAGDYIDLQVSDNGVGMSEEVRERALQPFFSTREQGTGHGLGLATVKNIVMQHHGCLRLDSVLGEGTTFCLHLPIRILATVAEGPQLSDSQRSGREPLGERARGQG